MGYYLRNAEYCLKTSLFFTTYKYNIARAFGYRGVVLERKIRYQWERFIENSTPSRELSSWEPDFGPRVLSRKAGKAEKACFQLLIDNPLTKAYLVGEFNSWGKDPSFLRDYEMKHDSNSIFCSIVTDKLNHLDKYKFLVEHDGRKPVYMQDPAGHYFDDLGNTIFWDWDAPERYRMSHGFIDTIKRSVRILQTDLPGLIVHWRDSRGRLGSEIPKLEYYRFIAESGVVEHISRLGFNAVQFLPFAQSIDGDNWKYRYLVPFQYAIQKNWGSPDEFARMVDEFHRHGIAVIGDFVISHFPHKDYKIFGISGKDNGIQNWLGRHGTRLYMKEETPWGSMRVDYDNPYVRNFIVQSCIHFMKRYRVDGFRIDNVDGILRYGPNGDGEERPNGRTFLRQLTSTIYDYNPFAMIHFESHFYYGDNAKMLVIPLDESPRALGCTAYNSSRITYYLHTEFMPKSANDITPWKFRDITEEKVWGRSSSTIADFHNHDAAAGLMELRCTGSYAYDAMTVKQPHNHQHAIGKIKVMEAIISFICEGRTLDLLQTFLLQTGSFEHDSSIQWHLTYKQASRCMVEFKRQVNQVMEDPAFWPRFAGNRVFLNVDDRNKILVVERSAEYMGKPSRFVVVINLSSWTHHSYKVGVRTKKDYRVMLNSDLFEYAGTGMASYPEVLENRPSRNFELLDREVELGYIAPYGIIVLKEVEQ